MSPAQKISLWADMLRQISALGLTFNPDIYNRQAFEKVQAISLEMMSLALNEDLAQLEALKSSVFMHPTPFSTGDGAVIDSQGRMLLIKRADNDCWAMPGGALEIGETPAEGAVREVLEETGVTCKALKLVGVFDSRLWGTVSAHHLYHFVFLCEVVALEDPAKQTHSHEVKDVGWFAEAELPAPLDPGHTDRIPYAFRFWRNEVDAFFDPHGSKTD